MQDEKLDIEIKIEPDVNGKKNINVYFFCLITLFYYIFPQGGQRAKNIFQSLVDESKNILP